MIQRKTKVCFKCGKRKRISQFYTHPQMADGHLGKCKACAKTDVGDNYELRREKYSEYERTRNQRPARKTNKASYQRTHRAKHPDRYKARQAVGNAIRDGRLIRLPCQYCGNEKSQAHHTDYSKPFEVEWACFKCHREHGHNQTVTQKTYAN